MRFQLNSDFSHTFIIGNLRAILLYMIYTLIHIICVYTYTHLTFSFVHFADRQKVLVHHPDKKSEDQKDDGDTHFKCIKIGQSGMLWSILYT